MKYVSIVLCCIIGFAAGACALEAPTQFVMMNPTTTTIQCVWANNHTTADSVLVVNADDSSVVARAASTGALLVVVTGLVPGTGYRFRAAVDSSGVRVYSDPDTLATAAPQAEFWIDDTVMSHFSRMHRATSWRPSGTYDETFTVAGTSGRDSTMVYYPWKYNGVMFETQGASVDVTAYCMAGYCPAEGGFMAVPVDSVTVSGPGCHIFDFYPPPSRHFYITFTGGSGNGSDTVLGNVFLSRDRH